MWQPSDLDELGADILGVIAGSHPDAARHLWRFHPRFRAECKPRELRGLFITYEKNVTRVFGRLHSVDDIPRISDTGTKVWFWAGEIHRGDDLPARIWLDGHTEWWIHGHWLRDGGRPATVCSGSGCCAS